MSTYNAFRTVLKRLDFKLVRSKKHETWQKILSLKALKGRIDQIFSDHISSITSRKLQNKIMQKLQGGLFE